MERFKALVLICLGSGSWFGCGGKESFSELSILDPSAEHLGRSYGEWAAEWVKYAYSSSPAHECVDPIQDVTGEHCTLFQNRESGVFFLNGTYGGPAHRDCQIPAESALFFPLVNTWNDNAGVPDEDVMEDAELRAFTQALVKTVVADSLYVRLDGKNVGGVQGGIFEEPAPYTVSFPAGPNIYTCYGVDDVQGAFNGYTAGAWAMLPPLTRGRHRLEFGGAATSSTAGEENFSVAVTYDLTVE